MNDEDWRDSAVCRDDGVPPDLFFPSTMNQRQRSAAQRFCRQCPVAADCHAWAVETHQRFGVWGGLDFALMGWRSADAA